MIFREAGRWFQSAGSRFSEGYFVAIRSAFCLSDGVGQGGDERAALADHATYL